MKNLLTLSMTIILSFLVFSALAQKQYKVAPIAFYNFENLFDTEDDPLTRDDDFTPDGDYLYTDKVYEEKLQNLATVVNLLGKDINPEGVAILGVCEVENRRVLEDLVEHSLIKEKNYQIVHYDSPDKRGIDVGLIYNPKYFKLLHSAPVPIDVVKSNGDTLFTRDILHVHGLLDGEPIHFLVNHWPSRRGGEQTSAYLRNHAATTARNLIDKLETEDPKAKVVLMGDLNDHPNNDSVKKHLRAEGKKKKVSDGEMYNPMYSFFKRGNGTTAWRDSWGLFDQIVITPSLLEAQEDQFTFFKAEVFNKGFLIQKTGRYKGYPYRTFSGGQYIGGFSDHLPVLIYLVKEV